MSSANGSRSPNGADVDPVKVEPAKMGRTRRAPAEASTKKLEYNRIYKAKKRALATAQLKAIKKWLDDPRQLDPLKIMAELKKRVSDAK
jgi:hypothetical protein